MDCLPKMLTNNQLQETFLYNVENEADSHVFLQGNSSFNSGLYVYFCPKSKM